VDDNPVIITDINKHPPAVDARIDADTNSPGDHETHPLQAKTDDRSPPQDNLPKEHNDHQNTSAQSSLPAPGLVSNPQLLSSSPASALESQPLMQLVGGTPRSRSQVEYTLGQFGYINL
jgi:hypothetical protein